MKREERKIPSPLFFRPLVPRLMQAMERNRRKFRPLTCSEGWIHGCDHRRISRACLVLPPLAKKGSSLTRPPSRILTPAA